MPRSSYFAFFHSRIQIIFFWTVRTDGCTLQPILLHIGAGNSGWIPSGWVFPNLLSESRSRLKSQASMQWLYIFLFIKPYAWSLYLYIYLWSTNCGNLQPALNRKKGARNGVRETRSRRCASSCAPSRSTIMGYAGFQGHLIWLIISRLSFPSFFFFFLLEG